ncbi:hypothetical protein ACPCVO_42045 [Streptomyces umbrinus]|uniref:hypothetical protein n=1 Tax=Streptomyces umbrinus TaxID=67370 RepID=UPI003C2EAC96
MGHAKAGELNGHAKDSQWYALTPAGEKAAMSSGGPVPPTAPRGAGSSEGMPGMP